MNHRDLQKLKGIAENGYQSDPDLIRIAKQRLDAEFRVLRLRRQFGSPYAISLHNAVIELFNQRYLDDFYEFIWAIICGALEKPSSIEGRTFEGVIVFCANVAFAHILPVVKDEVQAATGPLDSSATVIDPTITD